MSQVVSQLPQIIDAVTDFMEAWKRKPDDYAKVTFFGKYDIWHYMAITDDKTCRACMMLDQGVYVGIDLVRLFPYLMIVNDDQILPQVHPNCRCTMLRVTDLSDYITLTEPLTTLDQVFIGVDLDTAISQLNQGIIPPEIAATLSPEWKALDDAVLIALLLQAIDDMRKRRKAKA